MKGFRLALGVTVIACLWLGFTATTALAHASLESSDPANGELLDRAPDRITLTFTEPPDLSLTSVEVLDASGASMPTEPPERAPGSNHEISVRLDPLPDGVYTVTWRTVSATDGHVTAGAFSFGIGVSQAEITPVPGSTGGTEPPSAAAVAGHWFLYLGLVVLLGAGVTGLLAFGPTNVKAWLLALGWASAAVGVVLMTLAERSAVGVPLNTLLSSEAGGKFVLLAVTVLIAGAAALVVAVRPARATLVALSVTAAGAMLARAAGGHAAGSVATVLTQWFHLLGVGIWIGGLAWLFVSLRRGLASAQVRRFSTIAGVGLAVVVVSGVLRSTTELGWGWLLDPFQNGYSTTLVVKIAIVIPLIGLGAVNRFRNVARFEDLGSRPLLRTVGGELALAAAIFAATAVLTGLPPQPNEAPPGRGERPLVVTGSDFATTTTARLEISPGTVGPNTFSVEIADYDTHRPVDARRVSLHFELPDQPQVDSTLDLERKGETWQAEGTALAQAGTWDVSVLVEQQERSVEIPLEVTPEMPGQTIDVSKVPGQPTLYTITLEGGLQIQAYVDPGEPGRTNQVHVTTFDAEGKELPLHAATLSITPPEGAPFEPKMLRFGPGHFAANIDLTPGTWSFDIMAHAETGQMLSASFRQSFEG